MKITAALLFVASLLAITACGTSVEVQSPQPSDNSQSSPSAEDAKRFVEQTEKAMLDFSVDASRVFWINFTFLTHDTNALAAKVGAESTTLSVASERP